MGERQEDDVVVGKRCFQCGIEFVEAHGFSVLCDVCWDADEEDEGDRLPKATNEEVPED